MASFAPTQGTAPSSFQHRYGSAPWVGASKTTEAAADRTGAWLKKKVLRLSIYVFIKFQRGKQHISITGSIIWQSAHACLGGKHVQKSAVFVQLNTSPAWKRRNMFIRVLKKREKRTSQPSRAS